MARRRKSWVVEDKWKCSSCQSMNMGHDMTCKSCGNPKDASEKYELGDTSKPVTDPTKLREANAGENWSCRHCRFDNRDLLLKECASCGAPRFVTAPVEPEPSRPATDEPKSRPSRLDNTTVLPPPMPREMEPDEELPNFKPSRKPILLGILVTAAVLGLIALLVWFFTPHEHPATITSLHWERTRVLEQRYTLSGSGWGHPSGSFNVSCERRQHGTERCHPHNCEPHPVSCNCEPCHCHEVCDEPDCESDENGYSHCTQDCEDECDQCCDTCTAYNTCYDECPVYDDWCTYNYYEWRDVDTETTSGSDHSIRWGSRFSPDTSIPQRVRQSESYLVVFSENGKSWSYSSPSETDFSRFDVGVTWDVKTNYAGMIWPVHPL